MSDDTYVLELVVGDGAYVLPNTSSAAPSVTFHLLAETGAGLLAETGDNLRTE